MFPKIIVNKHFIFLLQRKTPIQADLLNQRTDIFYLFEIVLKLDKKEFLCFILELFGFFFKTK